MTSPLLAPEIVALLLPDELLRRFALDRPRAFDDPSGVFRLKTSTDRPTLHLEVWPNPNERDPCYVIELKFNFLGIPEIAWLAANDLAGPRFDVDAKGRLPLEPKSGLRNIEEEIRAMDYGLAPNQVYPGLHMLRHSLDAVDAYCRALSISFVTIFAMEYHNAIEYQRMGFTLRSGEKLMEEIERGFTEGGPLRDRLDGSTPFRRPEHAGTMLGRSWAIHDGIMNGEWYAPELVRVVT